MILHSAKLVINEVCVVSVIINSSNKFYQLPFPRVSHQRPGQNAQILGPLVAQIGVNWYLNGGNLPASGTAQKVNNQVTAAGIKPHHTYTQILFSLSEELQHIAGVCR